MSADNIHRLALELDELDGMADRVFHADDWCRERAELVQRLETVQRDIGTVLEAIA